MWFSCAWAGHPWMPGIQHDTGWPQKSKVFFFFNFLSRTAWGNKTLILTLLLVLYLLRLSRSIVMLLLTSGSKTSLSGKLLTHRMAPILQLHGLPTPCTNPSPSCSLVLGTREEAVRLVLGFSALLEVCSVCKVWCNQRNKATLCPIFRTRKLSIIKWACLLT